MQFVVVRRAILAVVCCIGSVAIAQQQHTESNHSRHLQWGSRSPDFYSLIAAADYTAASSTDLTIQVASEGTESVYDLQDEDWLQYSLGVPAAATYTLSLRLWATAEGGSLQIVLVDSDQVLATVSDLPVSAEEEWTTVTTELTLPVGMHMLEVKVETGGWSLQWMNLLPVDDYDESQVTMAPVATPVMAPESTPVSRPVAVSMAPVSTPVSRPVAVSMAPVSTPVSRPVAVSMAPVSTPVTIPVSTPVSTPAATPVMPPAVASPAVTPPPDSNCLLFLAATEYTDMSGVGQENGTAAVGWLDVGDYLVYDVAALPPATTYQLDVTLASPDGMGSFVLKDADTQEAVMYVDQFPATGDWNTYAVASTVFELAEGTVSLEVEIYSGGWNIQSLCFMETTEQAAPFTIPDPSTLDMSGSPSLAPVRPPHDCSSPF